MNLTHSEILFYTVTVIAAIATPFVVRARRRAHARFLNEFSDREVCEHLRPILQRLKAAGHTVVRAGQMSPSRPLEIHLAPPFNPKALYEEMHLQEPLRLSARNVLLCFDDECELRPVE